MKAVLLLSGGFDSPVSGYLIKKQGVEIIPIHFSYEPFTDNGPEIKTKGAAKILGFKEPIVINISKECEKIAKFCKHKYYFILTKRLMMRIAEKEARNSGCNFLITGENLSQVSSQTLTNLYAITKAVNIQILRPLLAYDKTEILKIAREIGTYEISIGPEACDVLGPKHPATTCDLKEIEDEEKKIIL